jgi:Domain of unknown function (DUF1729)
VIIFIFISYLFSLALLLTFPDIKDSLWAAEDIEAVFDQDPQRVRILQGPVATKGAIVTDNADS